MTSRKSSAELFRTTFFSALKGNFLLPALNLAVFSLAAVLSCYSSVRSIFDPAAGKAVYDTIGGGPQAQDLSKLFKYIIFEGYRASSGNAVMHVAAVGVSLLLGVMMFRFIAGKKTVNVFYSLGIKRSTLFGAKYSAGLLMLFASVALPFLACLAINAAYFGFSAELLTAVAFHIAGYTALCFMVFTVTAAVFSCVGTLAEGIAFSAVMLAAPSIFFFCLQVLMKTLTPGSPYGFFADPMTGQAKSLADTLASWNPVYFFYKKVCEAGVLARETADTDFRWVKPDFLPPLIWLAASGALALLAVYLFKRRKAEICGFLGQNRTLNFLAVFLPGIFFFSLCAANIKPVAVGAALGLGAMSLIYLVVDFALIRNFREWLRGMFKLPIHLAAALAVFFIFSTGLFGFSTYVPNPDKVESAEVSLQGYRGLLKPLDSIYYHDDPDYVFSVDVTGTLDGFTSKADIQAIAALHKEVAGANRSDSVDASFSVVYHLKNGKAVYRHFAKADMRTLVRLLEIENTQRYRDAVKSALTEPRTDADGNDAGLAKTFYQKEADVFLSSRFLDKTTPMELTAPKRKELLAALAADFAAQTLEQRYFAAEPALGLLIFRLNEPILDRDGGNPFEKPDTPSGTPFADAVDVTAQGVSSFAVTADMANTLRFLKDNRATIIGDDGSVTQQPYFDLLDSGATVAGARIIPFSSADAGSSYYPGYSEISYHFIGGFYAKAPEYGRFGGAFVLNDAETAAALAKKARFSYFTKGAGYFVNFELKDGGGYTTLFVPEQDMPAALKERINAFASETPVRN
ncbi:MAG: hypothetical protein BWY37_01567 [Firmicutes bacterium ADurb.Bin262]|nr:MAG: hypothetical protein BWY37_01567 [Firmicutes bacterium ADurb.Bin262]